MNDCVKKKANKAFNAIITNKDTTIVAVVKEPFFRSKLKSPNKILIEYLNDDRTINQICDWLLTEEYCREKAYKPISQLIIRIFKEAPEKVLASFSTNERLISRLQQFCKFEKKYFLIGFGHFQQIIELLSFATRGVFLQNFTDFTSTLLKCIDIISIRYLFLSLASNFTQAFGFSKDVVLKMIQSLDNSNQHHIMFLLSKLSRGKNTYFAFDHSKVIYSLFEIVVSPLQNEFITTQALQIIEYVKKNTIIKEKVDIILKYFESKIDFDNLPVNFSTSIILKLYNSRFIPSLILLMINNPAHMFLHEGVMASIESASDEVLIDFVEKNNVSVKLMWAMNVAKSNGFLTKFATILNEKRSLYPSLQTPEWENFVSNVLNRRLQILNNQFTPQFLNGDSQICSPQKKGQKRSNSTQSKKSQQQQINEKNKAKSDDEEKTQKEEKKRKEKNQKSKNDRQTANKDDASNRTEKIKNDQQNENKEDNSDKVTKAKQEKTKNEKIKNGHQNENEEDNSNRTGKIKKTQKKEHNEDSEKVEKTKTDKNKASKQNENQEENSSRIEKIKNREDKQEKNKNEQQNENGENRSNRVEKTNSNKQSENNSTKQEKVKNEQQNENREIHSNQTDKINNQQDSNIEDNSEINGKIKNEKVKNDKQNEKDTDKNKSKNKSKSKNEEIINKQENETNNNNESQNDTNKSNSEEEKSLIVDDSNKLSKIENNNIYVETIIENTNEPIIETPNNNPLPKILDSLLIKNLILQRLNQDKSENYSEKNINENENSSNNIEETKNSNEEANDQNNEIKKDKIKIKLNKDEIEENKKSKNIEDSKENDKIINSSTSKNKSEIKTPTKSKYQGLTIDVKTNPPKSNDKKNKNEQLFKGPIKQAHTPKGYEPTSQSNDHCRIALIKKKLYRNNEQSPQPKSPKDEKIKGRSFSVNWSPPSILTNNISKSDDINEDGIRHENIRKRFRNKIKYENDIKNQKLNINTNSNKKVFDLDDDFSSSSDENIDCITTDPNLFGPPSSNYFVRTIIGPAYFSHQIEKQDESGSDSSDDEFIFKFTPTPKRFKRNFLF